MKSSPLLFLRGIVKLFANNNPTYCIAANRLSYRIMWKEKLLHERIKNKK
jgi:hypothetical protein